MFPIAKTKANIIDKTTRFRYHKGFYLLWIFVCVCGLFMPKMNNLILTLGFFECFACDYNVWYTKVAENRGKCHRKLACNGNVLKCANRMGAKRPRGKWRWTANECARKMRISWMHAKWPTVDDSPASKHRRMCKWVVMCCIRLYTISKRTEMLTVVCPCCSRTDSKMFDARYDWVAPCCLTETVKSKILCVNSFSDVAGLGM